MPPKWHVEIVPLGPFHPRCDLNKLATVLNDCQHAYVFSVEDPIRTLPEPTRLPEGRGNVTPQYDVDQLTDFVLEQRPLPDHILRVCVIDHEIYEDLYSTIDKHNRIIIVSIRVEELEEVLTKSLRSYEDYMALEIGAQLLALHYRRKKTLYFPPNECGAPWHIDRRNCLFDYYGLDPQNVTKLMDPILSSQVRAELEAANIPESVVDATLKIVKTASRSTLRRMSRALWYDPIVTLVGGAWLGALIGTFGTSTQMFVTASVVIVAGLAWRVATVLKRSRRHYGLQP